MERKFDIICAGLMVYDILISPVDESVLINDTTRIDDISYATGGDALNAAIDAAALGAKVCLGGVVGADMPGRFLTEEAQRHGIDTSGVHVSDINKSSVSIVMRRSNGQRHFAYYGNANDEFDGSAISDELLSNAKMLYIGSMMALKSLEYQPLADLFARAKKQGTLTAMDSTWTTDGIWMPKLEKALPYCDIFIPSLYEAEQICGTQDPKEIVSFLHDRGVKVAGVKMGADGVFIEDFSLPAFNCENVVDTTGAGDAFLGGFITGYTFGMSIYDSALLGSAVSNCCIRKVGAVTGAPDMQTAKNTIEMFKNGTLK